MRLLKGLLILLLVSVLGLAALFHLVPARAWVAWLLPAAAPLQLEGVEGSLVNGHAAQLSWRGKVLGPLDWHLHPMGLLQQRVQVDLDLRGEVYAGQGFVDAGRDQVIRLRDVSLRLPAEHLAGLIDTPALQMLGQLQIELANAELNHLFPTALSGDAVWKDAAVMGAAQANLGDVRVRFERQNDGRIVGTVTDSGGPLQIEQGQFSADLSGLKASARLLARDGNAQVQQALAYIGQPQSDGSSLFQLEAKLIGSAP
ncbi:MAG: type II secretion system protein N [Lysobacteraceae bacterium]